MANSNTNMANREVADLIFVDYATKKPFLNLDFANVTTTELTGENVYAYGGKGHPKKVSFSGEKGGTLTIETQIQTVKLWQLITGGEVSKTAKFMVREELAVTGSGATVTLSEAPVAGSVVVYKADDGEEYIFKAENITTSNTHGTGCTLSSAIASYLALGHSLSDSVKLAKQFVTSAIKTGSKVTTGKGHGPLNHFFAPQPLHILKKEEDTFH